jgi:DNA-binding transcriptional ArsR family regulator
MGELKALAGALAARRAQFERLAGLYSLLAGETRLRILALLESAGELCVCDLATVLEMTPAAVSQHLSRLRSGGMVAARRDGMTIFYRRVKGASCPPLDLPDLCPQRSKRGTK